MSFSYFNRELYPFKLYSNILVLFWRYICQCFFFFLQSRPMFHHDTTIMCDNLPTFVRCAGLSTTFRKCLRTQLFCEHLNIKLCLSECVYVCTFLNRYILFVSRCVIAILIALLYCYACAL